MRQVYTYKEANIAACHNCAVIHTQRGETDKVLEVTRILPLGSKPKDISRAVADHVRNHRHTDGLPCPYSNWPTNKIVASSKWAWGVRLYRLHPEEQDKMDDA